MGTRKQKQRRWREGTGGGTGGQLGGNGRGQASRPRPHVSKRETRKKEKKSKMVSQHRGVSWHGRRGEGPRSRRREMRGGRGRRTAERSAVTAGHSNVGGRGKRSAEKHGERKTGERGKEEDEGDATHDGDVEENRKNGKRLGRSLRTHPQPESTTLSVLSRKDLPA